jgi:hypothetical protein
MANPEKYKSLSVPIADSWQELGAIATKTNRTRSKDDRSTNSIL